MILAGDLVKYGSRKPSRVDAYFKARVIDEESIRETCSSKMMAKLITMMYREEKQSELDAGRPANQKLRLVACLPEDATHYELASNTIVRVEQCKNVGTVDWTATELTNFRAEAIAHVGSDNFEFNIWE